MNIGYIGNLFLCSLITLLFAILVFIVGISFKNSAFHNKWLIKYKPLAIFFDIFFGAILSFSYLMTFYLAFPTYPINAVMVLMIILPGVMFVGPYFALGGITCLIIPIFTFAKFDNNIILSYVFISYGLYLISTVFCYFIFRKWSQTIRTIIAQGCFMLLQVALVLVLTLVFKDATILPGEMWMTSGIIQIFILIAWLTFVYINKIYKKAQNMNIQVAHDFKYFVVADYAFYAINDFIRTRNVQYAYIVGFSLKNIVSSSYNIGDRTVNAIKSKIANSIYEQYKSDDTLFFISDEGFLFMMIKTTNKVTKTLKSSYSGNYILERSKDDVVYEFQQFGKKAYNTSIYNVKIEPKINLMVGIYGVHSNDAHELIQNVEMLIDWYEPNVNDNIVHVFNPAKEFTGIKDMLQYQQLCAVFDVKTIKVQFHQMEYNGETIVIPTYSAFNLAAFNIKKIVESVSFNLRPILLKHLSAKAIQAFSLMERHKIKLMINYPVESLMYENFSSQMFYSKLTKFNVDSKSVILLMNLDYLQANQDVVITNVLNLKKLGVDIVCTNVSVKNIDFIKAIKPYFVFYKKYKKQIAKEHEYETLMRKLLTKTKVKYYAG